MLVDELMTSEVITVQPDTSLKDVARLLSAHGIGGAPVVASDGRVVGVISESDFLIKERGRDHAHRSPLHWLLGDRRREFERVEATTAGEAMTAPAITIAGRVATVRDAAIVMAEHRINRLPVTRAGKLVGIITRGDVLRLYTRADQEIEATARHLLRAVDGIAVEGVHDGVVVLAGTVPSHPVADTAARVIEAVDGVVAVDATRMAWRDEPEPILTTISDEL
jgi:CBS domain-containing protein